MVKVVRHSATSAAAQENNAVRRLNMLRGQFLRTKVMGIITFLCLKPQQTTGFSMIKCQGYSWKQNTHQGSAPWMIPPVSRNSQENFFVAEGCVKDYLEHLTLLDLKKDKRKKERLAKKSAEASKTYKSITGMRRLKMAPLVGRQQQLSINTWSITGFALHQTSMQS